MCYNGVGQTASTYVPHTCKGLSLGTQHNGCRGIKGRLKTDSNFKCKCYTGKDVPMPPEEVRMDEGTLEVVDSVCYLLRAGGSCELSSSVRIKTARDGKFRQLFPILSHRYIPLETRGKLYGTCVRSVMIYGSVCWTLKRPSLARMLRNHRAGICWICNVKPHQYHEVSTLC